MGSLLVNLSREERQELHLEVFFPTLRPRQHPSFDQNWLNGLIDGKLSYDASDDLISESEAFEQESFASTEQFQSKNPRDYTYALERCLTRTDSPYIAVFEDDIIAADSWLPRTMLALDQIDLQQQARRAGVAR